MSKFSLMVFGCEDGKIEGWKILLFGWEEKNER